MCIASSLIDLIFVTNKLLTWSATGNLRLDIIVSTISRVVLSGAMIKQIGKVPTRDYSGYVRNFVKELYGPLRVSVKGDLTGLAQAHWGQ